MVGRVEVARYDLRARLEKTMGLEPKVPGLNAPPLGTTDPDPRSQPGGAGQTRQILVRFHAHMSTSHTCLGKYSKFQ
eukprot:7044722-Prymnesium_polylepis.1